MTSPANPPLTAAPEPELPDDDEEVDDGYCGECGDEFHYDDCGGYNPPCECCGLCRSCHHRLEMEMVSDDIGDDDLPPESPTDERDEEDVC